MSLLVSTQSISKSFGAQTLFSNISIGFLANERFGLIGPNGSGKSTLLKILTQLESPDEGSVVQNRDAHLGYLPQMETFDPDKTIEATLLEAFSETVEEQERYQRIRAVTSQLEFGDMDQKMGTLSGGWQKRVAIVRAVIQQPDLLFMDEPTNHLDLEGILWLETLLKQARFAFVLVSHDRYFLENVTNRIVELNKQYPDGFFKIEGNYSEFLRRREEFLSEQAEREQVLSNKVRRELEWLHRGPKARTTKAQYRIDNAQQLQDELSQVKSRNVQNMSMQIDFDATHRKTKKLIEAKSLSMALGGKMLFSQLDLVLSPGKCLGLMGKNGSGKSTLLSLLKQQRTPDSGSIHYADGAQIVMFDQKREQLDPKQTLRQALSPTGGDNVIFQGRPLHVVSWAKRFLFPSDQLRQPVSELSGGEKARVLIANLMLQPADVLLLDEPTNDLDIPTLEVLEDSLKEFPGAIVLITHDRFLLDRLSDQILCLNGDGAAEYFADYDQWYQSRSQTVVAPSVGETPSTPKKSNKKLSNDERKELNRIENKIQKAEEKVAQLQEKLQDPEIMSNSERLAEIYKQVEDAEHVVEQLYERWEELEALKSNV